MADPRQTKEDQAPKTAAAANEEAITPKAKKRKAILFVWMGENPPNGIDAYSRHAGLVNGTQIGAEYGTVPQEMIGGQATGRFVIGANDRLFDEKLKGMRALVETGRYPIAEISDDPDKAKMPEWAHRQMRDRELALQAQAENAGRSNIEIAAANVTLRREKEDIEKENAELREKLAKAGVK